MPKIIHAADIHLDAPFSLCDVQKAQVRKNELRGAFSSLILFAKTEKADMVVLSGDVFDSGFVTKETTSLLLSQFASFPECKFVIAPGNHDPYTQKSPYAKEVFPPNVYIFNEDRMQCFSFDDIGVDVYGFAYTSESCPVLPPFDAHALNRDRINLFVAHCDLNGHSTYCPITTADLARSGFDYAALGHIHKGGDVGLAGATYYAYSGCLEGRSFDECGLKGVIVCEFGKEGGRFSVKFANRRLCRRHYERLSVEITGVADQKELAERVRAAIVAAGYGTDTLLRVHLSGRVSSDSKLNADALDAQELGVFYLETENASLPTLDGEALKNDISVRGAFYRELLPKLESGDEAERKLAAAALRYGLAALDGDDVVDF